ncbi:MAG: hypothetical protein PCFJNLEI_02388 [Verrucomicrobiae bacterium]|nr:hypothetical protein [Verrucomicrobiae bacterium]
MNTQAIPQTSTVRCPECGLKTPGNAPLCENCNATLPQHLVAAGSNASVSSGWNIAQAALPVTAQEPWLGEAPAIQRSRTSTPPTIAPTPRNPSLQGDLVGRVILMEAPYQEKPDFDWCKFFTKVLWFLLLVASPILLLHVVLTKLGALPVILAVVGVFFLLRFITPSNLFALWRLHAVMSPLKRQDQEMVPVRYLRVRDENEDEWTARMKGNTCLGNVSPDDLVSLWGYWRGGTLFVKRGFNHRTRSQIQFQNSYSWIGLVVTLGVILFLFCWFYQPIHTLGQRMHELGGSL